MATEVVLPQWGMNMQEGTIVAWLKEEGDPIQQGEPFAEVETEKINTVFEAPVSGVIAHRMVAQGETVPVGTLLVIIAQPGEVVPRPGSARRPGAAAPIVQATSGAQATPPTPPTLSQDSRPIQVVPAARRLAQEHGIDLSTVRGTGPGARILETDVRQSIAAAAQPSGQVVSLTGMRKTIADRMLQSAQNTAQVTLHTEADVTALVQFRQELVGQWRAHRLRPLDLDLIVKATARALSEHPQLNATLVGDQLQVLDDVNIGLATATPRGLMVPVVRQASRKSVLKIAQELRELAERARSDTLSQDDVTGGSFTITSLASYGIDAFTPLINPPQVAILGVGRVLEKPAVVDKVVTIRPMMSLSLTFDHRALDGAPAAEFLQTVCRHLREPRWMAE